ncbi:MAG: glutamate--tRNA ligase [Sphaerobacteraceae bacterium]|nr:MAG: glutamate--tRNA ligase [Sphaerobacteraceae bacterium]
MTTGPARVRFAPSPTGDLHVGGARTALFNWIVARQTGGKFILRIEDTDQNRLVGESIDGILESIRWLGLDWDEGPLVEGPHAPYFQSQRLDLYTRYVHQLVDAGHAYPCFCSAERLAEVREQQRARKEPPGYDRHCRNLSKEEVQAKFDAGETAVYRFKMPLDGETSFYDLLRGEISYENRNLQDLVLLKTDGYPTYHMANVVDDHLMEISHIMRADEWIPTAPLHVQMYQAFGWEPPIYAHMPVVLRPDGKGKLSKRDGAVGVLEYQQKGYLPEAVVNYLALLGWAYDDKTEIFTIDELIEKFNVEKVNPSPARYSFEKLEWMNQHYINHVLELDDVAARCVPFLVDAGLVDPVAADTTTGEFAKVRDTIELVKDRLKYLTEAPELVDFFFKDETDDYDAETLVPRKTEPETALAGLKAAREGLADIDFSDEEALEAKLRELAEEIGLKAGQMFMPIRVAVSGRTVSPGLFETLRVLGRDTVLARIDIAIQKLQAHSA